MSRWLLLVALIAVAWIPVSEVSARGRGRVYRGSYYGYSPQVHSNGYRGPGYSYGYRSYSPSRSYYSGRSYYRGGVGINIGVGNYGYGGYSGWPRSYTYAAPGYHYGPFYGSGIGWSY